MGWREFAVRAARVNYVQPSRDVTHVINSPRLPSPLFPYCKRRKAGREGWERGYRNTTAVLSSGSPWMEESPVSQ